MLHQIDFGNLHADIKKRGELISEFLESLQLSEGNLNSLVWKGKVSHLAFIISNLALEGYIEMPEKHDGEINYTELSRQILTSFRFRSKPPSIDTLRRYSDIEGDKVYYVKSNFIKNKFHIPNSKIVS